MIKETKKIVATEWTEKHKYCDVCQTEVEIGLSSFKAVCNYCKKDLCEKCIKHEEETWGDYRIVYCEECWGKGYKYRPDIGEHQDEIRRLYKEWQNECKNNGGNENEND